MGREHADAQVDRHYGKTENEARDVLEPFLHNAAKDEPGVEN